jgi:hypothetical protein
VSGERIQTNTDRRIVRQPSPPQDNFESALSLRKPELAAPFYLPGTVTFIEQLGISDNTNNNEFIEEEKKAQNLFYQVLNTQEFHEEIQKLDIDARSRLSKTEKREEQLQIRSDVLSKISGTLVEYAAYIHLRNHLPENHFILSPRETHSIYATTYMTKETRKEPKTEPDGLIFAAFGDKTMLVAATEYTAYSDNVYTTSQDTQNDIAIKVHSKLKQRNRKEEQINLHVNGTVPQQLLEKRSSEWRKALGGKLQERFSVPSSQELMYDPHYYTTILAMPEGQPIPFDVKPGISIPIPIYRGMISEFSQRLITDLDEIHWYSLNEPIPITEEEFYPAPSEATTVISLPLEQYLENISTAADDD